MSEFNKKVGKDITKTEADGLIKKWKEKSGQKTHSSFFGTDIVQRLLNKPGSVGIRIHYGMDKDGNIVPVLTAEIDKTMVTTETAALSAAAEDPEYVNASLGCPPYCPK